MVISRTPFRISFFGGGTDYPAWYEANSGAVLATSINKYCYISCRYLPPFFEYKYRILYSKVEHINHPSEIMHPSVKACLLYLDINKGVEIHHDGDLPARTGMGSSSSFTVGLLNALYAMKGIMSTKRRLALDAIQLEQEIMRENVGCQDQTQAAFGGFNLVEFGGKNHINVSPVTISQERLVYFQDHLMLFYSGLSRTASEIAAEQIKTIPQRQSELKQMRQMVDQALAILNSNADLSEFGRLLHENWLIKRSLSHKISTQLIDEIYAAALNAGATGGKLLGAGGGGFVLIFARPQAQPKVKEALKKLLLVPFRFENSGSQIIFYSPNDSIMSS